MSEGSLGNLKWIIDADDSAFNAKLDRAEAKVREWAARVSGITGSSAPSPTTTTTGTTFGGVSMPNVGPTQPSVAPGVAAANAADAARRRPGGTVNSRVGSPAWEADMQENDNLVWRVWGAQLGTAPQQFTAGLFRQHSVAEINAAKERLFAQYRREGSAIPDAFGVSSSTSGPPSGAGGRSASPSAYELFARSAAGPAASTSTALAVRLNGGTGAAGGAGSNLQWQGVALAAGTAGGGWGPIPNWQQVGPVGGGGGGGTPPGGGAYPGWGGMGGPYTPPGGGGGGGARAGGFLSAPNWRGLMISAMFGGWETARAYQQGMIGETAVGLAHDDVARMHALNQQVQGQWGGIFASSIGLGMDLLAGRGPTSLLTQVMTNTARVQASEGRAVAQMQAANIRRIVGISPDTAEGVIQRREAVAIGEYNLTKLQLDKEITDARHVVNDRGTHQVRNWLYGGMLFDRPNVTAEQRDVAQNNLNAAQARLAGADLGIADVQQTTAIELRRYRQDQSTTHALQNIQLREVVRDTQLANASINATPLQVAVAAAARARAGRADAIGAQAARGAIVGGVFGGLPIINPAIGIEAGRQDAIIAAADENVVQTRLATRNDEFTANARIYAAQDVLARRPREAQRALWRDRHSAHLDPDAFRNRPHELMLALSQDYADQDLMEQGFKDDDTNLALNQRVRQVQLGLAIKGNLTGAQAVGTAGAAIERANRLAQAGLGQAAANELGLGKQELELQAQNYLRRFRGQQVGYLEVGAPGRQGLDDPREVLKTIDQQISALSGLQNDAKGGDSKALADAITAKLDEVKDAINSLASD